MIEDERDITLVDVELLKNVLESNPDVFPELAIKYAEESEKHVVHLVTLLGARGIHCCCDGPLADQQCLIHVHANLPDE